MKINHKKTVEMCRIVNRAEVARRCNTSPAVVHHVLHGTYPYMESDAAKRVIAFVKKHNLLVEEPETDQAA